MVLQCCCWAWRVQHGAAVKAAANETRHLCYVITWAKLFRRVGLTNRSAGRLSARDNQYTNSAILNCTRLKFIASSIISLFDISSASHNYDTSSSIHKFDITRHTTCSISIWVSEYKCILKKFLWLRSIWWLRTSLPLRTWRQHVRGEPNVGTVSLVVHPVVLLS